MSNTPEYLKQPDHVQRANQFISQVNTAISNKYPELLINTFNSQEGDMESYDNALRGNLPELILRRLDLDKMRRHSFDAEMEALYRIDVQVIVLRQFDDVEPAEFEQIEEAALKAKEEIERLARSFGGEKDEFVERIIKKIESMGENEPYTVSSLQHFVFRQT